MEDSFPSRLTMYLKVKTVCDAKPMVWRRSEAFIKAFADFCERLEKIATLQIAVGIFHTVARYAAVEMAAADLILTTQMDELIEQFEPVDVGFVDDYTAARSMEIPDEDFAQAGSRSAL
jgi:hypothetical protein